MAHEYDHDWSTDPDYGDEGIGFSEFEEDGALIASDAQSSGLQVHMLDTARNRIGHRASANPTCVFVPQQVGPMGLYTRQGSPVDRVKPDPVVMPAEEDVPGAHDRDPERTARPDDPVPELVLAILWKSTATRDLGDQRRLYEALGVVEYLTYDLGGRRGPDSPRELLMYRLVDEAYRRVDPDPGLSKPAAAALPERGVRHAPPLSAGPAGGIREIPSVAFRPPAGTTLPVVGRGTGTLARPGKRYGVRVENRTGAAGNPSREFGGRHRYWRGEDGDCRLACVPVR